MKYLMLFLSSVVIISTVLASGSDPDDPDYGNGEIVMYDVSATSDSGINIYPIIAIGYHWADASVCAESGSEGYSSVWAEAGFDRDDSYEGSSYIAGSQGHSRYKYAGSYVPDEDPPHRHWGYLFKSANITSQDDQDWSPKYPAHSNP